MIRWLRHQHHAFVSALRRLIAHPLAMLFTALAMGVAISLPSGLYLILDNVSQLAGQVAAQPEISLFLAPDITPAQQQALTARLRQTDIASARYVPKAQALDTLSSAQGLADISAGLADNPLPDAWVVRPRDRSHAALTRVATHLSRQPGVAETHLDSQWAQRLQAALAIGRTGVALLAGLFALALLAIIGNAIRAQVLARRDEILVSRLIGATDRHIRRPFLYLGALQGLLGGLAAGAVLAGAGWSLREPVAQLARLYESTFTLHSPTPPEMALVLGLTALFGWLGAWLAVARALRQVDGLR